MALLLWQRWGERFAAVAVAVSLVAGGIYSYSIVWKSPVSTSVRMFFVPIGLYA